MNKEDRIARAMELHRSGYNCAQCVAMTFADKTGIDETALAHAAEGFGSGMGGCGEVCGALSGAIMIAGFLHSRRPEIYSDVKGMALTFKSHNGSLLCRELKGAAGNRPCSELIADAVATLCDLTS